MRGKFRKFQLTGGEAWRYGAAPNLHGDDGHRPRLLHGGSARGAHDPSREVFPSCVGATSDRGLGTLPQCCKERVGRSLSGSSILRWHSHGVARPENRDAFLQDILAYGTYSCSLVLHGFPDFRLVWPKPKAAVTTQEPGLTSDASRNSSSDAIEEANRTTNDPPTTSDGCANHGWKESVVPFGRPRELPKHGVGRLNPTTTPQRLTTL